MYRAFVLLLFVASLTSAADPKPHVDSEGFPLPAEAVQRFGSARFCTDPPRSVAFSPDGKVAYLVPIQLDFLPVDHDPVVSAWEVATGRVLWQFVDQTLTGLQVTADPNGKTVWLAGRIGRGQYGWHEMPFVRVKLDAATGKELSRKKLLPGWSPALDLRPDGTLAWNRFEAQEGAKDGDLSLRVLKPDGTDGPTWEPLDGMGIDKVKFAPDGKTLFVSGRLPESGTLAGNGSKLAAVDVATSQTNWSNVTRLIDTMAVSPDGKVLATANADDAPPKKYEPNYHPSKTVVVGWHADTGTEIGSVSVGRQGRFWRHDSERETDGRPLTFSRDGKTLLTMDDDRRTVPIDVASWKPGPAHVNVAARGWVTPDGKVYLATNDRASVSMYDAETHAPRGPKQSLYRSTWWEGADVSFSSDSKRLRFGAKREFEVNTGKELPLEPQEQKKDEPVVGVANLWNIRESVRLLSPNGKLLFHRYGYDSLSGKRREPQLLDAQSGEPAAKLVFERVDLIAFTADSKRLIGMAVGGDVYLWDLSNEGKPLKEARLNNAGGGGVNPLMLLTDKWAVVAEPNWGMDYFDPRRSWSISRFPFTGFKREKTWRGRGAVENIVIAGGGSIIGWARVYHGEGKEPTRSLFVIDPGADAPREYPLEAGTGFAVSVDGRSAAFGVGSGSVEVYELATGKRRHTFTGLKRMVNSLAFSPNGRYLASVSPDGPVLIWDVRGDLTKPTKPGVTEWDDAWKSLGEKEAESAFNAIRLFALYPDEGGAELVKRFAVTMPPDLLRAERAVEAMLLADTDGARKRLAEWAKGPASDPLTVAAKRAEK